MEYDEEFGIVHSGTVGTLPKITPIEDKFHQPAWRAACALCFQPSLLQQDRNHAFHSQSLATDLQPLQRIQVDAFLLRQIPHPDGHGRPVRDSFDFRAWLTGIAAFKLSSGLITSEAVPIMRRDCSHLLPLISILLLFPALSYGQAWSGVLAPSRAIDWSNAGLPATFPDGETTPNPWTPPTRTQCVTSACNTVSGGTVTVASINAALSSAPAGTYVLIPAGTFSLSGTIQMASNVTLRGSGAQATILSGTPGINWGANGTGSWGGATLLTASPAKGATSVSVTSASGLSGGMLVRMTQCMTGFSAPNANFTHYSGGWVASCTGTVSDPGTAWVCGGFSQCDRNGNRNETNPHYQAQNLWIPSGGIRGNTVSFSSPVESPLWSTGNSVALSWMSSSVVVGAGLEDVTWTNNVWGIIAGTYACWLKGNRFIVTGTPTMTSFNSHSLIANNYFVTTDGTLDTVTLGAYENDDTSGSSDLLFLNNIFIGAYIEESASNSGMVMAYNYFAGSSDGGTLSYAGEFQHSPGGQILFLREGNIAAINQDDDTWTTHNFDTWFRNWDSGSDALTGKGNPNPVDMGCFTRFDNVIGNVVSSSLSTSYAAILGNCREGLDSTGLSQASQMIWGNYTVCNDNAACSTTGSAIWAQNPTSSSLSTWPAAQTYANINSPSQSLPASFFMNSMTAHPSGGTGLSWWKTCSSWTTFPTSCASYTTPPMPPIGPDVTGGQNISGHAYNIPAYIAYNSLPLDSNYPGTPNGVRQFDERVYQSDLGGTASSVPPPPTNLSATVQ